jgi:hypothetical protein
MILNIFVFMNHRETQGAKTIREKLLWMQVDGWHQQE